MAGGASGGDEAPIVGINITPMVDIVLVLLIIFIVTAKIIVTPAVEMDLPEASTANEVQVVLSVILPQRGATLVNGEPIEGDVELARRAAAIKQQSPQVRAVIHADGEVAHRRVIAAVDALRRGGVARVAFASLAPETGPPGQEPAP
jgi:biopolymer transport protein ExbD